MFKLSRNNLNASFGENIKRNDSGEIKRNVIDKQQMDSQAGFLPNTSFTDQKVSLHIITELSIQVNLALYIDLWTLKGSLSALTGNPFRIDEVLLFFMQTGLWRQQWLPPEIEFSEL